MSQRQHTPQRAAAFTVCGLFCLLGCLNPRPEELPSEHEDPDLIVAPEPVPSGPVMPENEGPDPGVGAPGQAPAPTDAPAENGDAGDAGAPPDAGGVSQAEARSRTCQDAGD
jgi:hypothetical protein